MEMVFQRLVKETADIKLEQNDLTQRNQLLALALGLAIAKHVQLPSTEVEQPIDFFNNNLQAIRSTLSRFNENVIFDIKEAEEFVRAFWLIRYNAMYQRVYPLFARQNQSFVDCLFGVSDFISESTMALADKYAKQIFMLTVTIQSIIKEEGL